MNTGGGTELEQMWRHSQILLRKITTVFRDVVRENVEEKLSVIACKHVFGHPRKWSSWVHIQDVLGFEGNCHHGFMNRKTLHTMRQSEDVPNCSVRD